MIYDRENIQISELCPIQFTEPREYEFYNMQQEYVGKIKNFGFDLQILISEAVYNSGLELYAYLTDENDEILNSKILTFIELSTGYYYANVNLDASFFSGINNKLCRFKLIDNESETLADSVWYLINPIYTKDLKKIKCFHNENDWNTIFIDGETNYNFWIDVECGFIPRDGRDEQETDDFIEQDMLNDTVYGDGYKVDPLTIGGSMGVPNWLRNKLFRYFLCDNVTIDNEEVKRINGAKIEKIEDCENGLATYKIDLQTTNNYLQ